MPVVKIRAERCKACGWCIEVCPKGVIRLSAGLNERGHHPAEQTDTEECTACGLCALVCPDVCIAIYK
jgi:2-oxoglutarate ferredoxin oxidoreductase subunit delta